MTAPDTDALAGLREELRLIGCHQNGDARCTCSIGADALDAIDALRAQATKDKARIERLEAALRKNRAEMLRIGANLPIKAVNAIPMNLLRAWEAAENAALAALEDRE